MHSTSSSSEDLSRFLSDSESFDAAGIAATPLSSVGKSGETSPSSICCQRKMSAAVATTRDAKHVFLKGRPKIIVPFGKHSPPRAPLPSGKRGLSRPIHKRSLTAPANVNAAQSFSHNPQPMRLAAWEQSPTSDFKVRGKNYLKDRIKEVSGSSVFKLVACDMIGVKETMYSGFCAHPNERVQRAIKLEKETELKVLPDFVFAVNLVLPGPDFVYHCVSYFAVDDKSILTDTNTPFGRVAKPFFFGESDEFRDKTFKLIPRIVDGNFIVRNAVGSKPAILGQKVKQHYIRNERFFELIIDVASDSVASGIVKLALGYAKSLVVDMMFVLESTEEDQLPERILGGLRMINVDFKGKDGQRRITS